MTARSVVVVGSLHYDIMVDAPHRPAAGETVTGHSWAPKFGGKGGNQALALARAGVDVRMVSAVGTDAYGDFLIAHLHRAGISTTHVAALPDAPSGMSVAITDASGDYGAVIVSGANLHIPPAQLDRDDLWSKAAYLVLQNEVPAEINIAAARQARQRRIPVCLNAAPWRPIDDALTDHLDLLVVNAVEAAAMTGLPVDDLTQAKSACDAISRQVPSAIVTAGAHGLAWHAQGRTGTIAGQPVAVVSTHGAGDHFIGTLIAALVSGNDLDAAAARANVSAARFVSRETS